MKRILIVYDSKGGSTKEIIGWIMEGITSQGAYAEAATVASVGSLDYDIIVVGTPIYYEKPMKSIRDFLRKSDLRGRNIALFVVCFAGVFGMRNFMVRKYLEDLRRICTGNVIKETSFDAASGPWRKLNRAICIDFGKELAGHTHRRSTAIETA